MADFDKPAVADNYSTGYTPAIVDNFRALAQGLDPAVVTPSNVPTGAIRWRSANNYWEKYNGTSWVALTATYAISISGNAATATKWATGRTIALTGDVTGTSGAFDGSGNLSFAGTLATVNSNVGTFGGAATALSVTVDGKGRITAISNTAIVIGWAAITSGKPTTLAGYGITDAAASSHTHGNITNAGAIGSTSGLPIITTTGGVMTAGAWGTTAGTFCQGNDSRLSNARTPTAHNHSATEITSGTMATAQLGSGTANSGVFLRGDSTWAAPPAVAIASTAEAQAGTNNTNALTPLRLREGLNASGSAPVYACRAWVNFNGTGAVAIRASGNVSSITDLGVGQYRVNFAVGMPHANYSVHATGDLTGGEGNLNRGAKPYGYATGSVTVGTGILSANAAEDFAVINVSVTC